MRLFFIILITLIFLPPALFYLQTVVNSVKALLGYEVCNDNYINPNFGKLKKNLKKKLFGQHLVVDKLLPMLESHFKFKPKKALVISMHGWTGSGKNYVTQLVSEAIYKKKHSHFVQIFNGRLHFPLDHEKHVNEYKINIRNWIKGNVTKCPRSLFVFDEIDKIPAGVIDAVKPFFDFHEKIDLVDFRKSMFVFISNIGAEVINSQYLKLWKGGVSRADMEYKHFESSLRKALYKGKGAFKGSSILENHLVSLYLPFLPLGEEHVKACIQAELERQKVKPVTSAIIATALSEMEFNYDGFSLSGCKRVADIVASLKIKNRIVEDL